MPVLEARRCPACGTHNDPDSLFCGRCVAPLGIKPLAEFDAGDYRACAEALAETLTVVAAPRESARLDETTADLLEAYLNLHWLRPETALWQALEARAVLERADEFVRGPLLDLGCGDGTHGAVMFGTRFDPQFDVFSALRLNAPDIYDSFDPRRYQPRVVHRGRPIDVGVDIRDNIVRRARALGAHRRVLKDDATSLSLPDRSVATVYSNVIRDLPDAACEAALRQVARVLEPGGTLILPAPAPQWRDALYFDPAARAARETGDFQGAERLAALDRGRSVSFAQQKSEAAWRERLAACGLEIVDRQHTHARHVVRFWDVGLRPFSVPLLQWVGGLSADQRFAIKRSIVHTLRPLLERFVALPAGDNAAHVMYFVRKPAG